MSAAHLLLTQAALLTRDHANELLLAHKQALKNAEALEEVICNGTDAEVKEALRLVTNPQE